MHMNAAGVHYTTWWYDTSPNTWANTWGTPLLGRYASGKQCLVRQCQ